MIFNKFSGGWTLFLPGFVIIYKNQSQMALFSEREGYVKPLIKIGGRRLFIERRTKRRWRGD